MMSSKAATDQEVIEEDDIDEDEHLYQFVINIDDPNPKQTVEYDDTSDEESPVQPKNSTRLKLSLSNKNNGRVEDNALIPAEENAAVVADDFDAEDTTVLNYAQTVSNIDWGSIAHIKHGIAGESAEKDRFPFFNKTYKHWIHFLWDGEPSEWVLLFLEQRIEESEENFDQLPLTRRILLSDITEVYLELPPSTSFRIYVNPNRADIRNNENAALVPTIDSDVESGVPSIVSSADTAVPSVSTSATFGTGALQSAPLPTVIKITPVPMVRGHAAMWVDALYSAMQLQCHEPIEEVNDIRREHYQAIQLQAEAGAAAALQSAEEEVEEEEEGGIVMVSAADGGHNSSVILGGSDESQNGLSDLENGSPTPRGTRRPAAVRSTTNGALSRPMSDAGHIDEHEQPWTIINHLIM